jgi:hypothetical protein
MFGKMRCGTARRLGDTVKTVCNQPALKGVVKFSAERSRRPGVFKAQATSYEQGRTYGQPGVNGGDLADLRPRTPPAAIFSSSWAGMSPLSIQSAHRVLSPRLATQNLMFFEPS